MKNKNENPFTVFNPPRHIFHLAGGIYARGAESHIGKREPESLYGRLSATLAPEL